MPRPQVLPRLYLRSSTGLGQAPETSGGPGGRVLPSTRFCLLSLCPCLALGISAESHRQTHFSPATKMQETGDSQWRTVLQSLHRGTVLCFPLKQIGGEGAPSAPTWEGGLPLSRGPGGLCRQRWAGTARPLGLDSLFFPLQGLGAPRLACEGVRPENVPLSLSEPCLLRPEV